MLICMSNLSTVINSAMTNWKTQNFLECKASIDKSGWFKYTKNPIKGMGLMKHNLALSMVNDENTKIYDDNEYKRTHRWEFDIPKEKFSLFTPGEPVFIVIGRKKTFYGYQEFGRAEIDLDLMITDNSEEVAKFDIIDEKKNKKVASLNIMCEPMMYKIQNDY